MSYETYRILSISIDFCKQSCISSNIQDCSQKFTHFSSAKTQTWFFLIYCQNLINLISFLLVRFRRICILLQFALRKDESSLHS